ncbi:MULTISPECIES: NYN domain-containing protein [unclassified Burkholderia]|uniref:NYN domain-containing protein n=1 Tax=unclassified Burkholderia TaxID=2613784 RepID=UPI00163959C5|nr:MULTISPECIES: NYN domain-containing protein [unclassified Burkholderia]
MDRVAVFVDAGHVFAGGSASISGSAKKRHEITLNVPAIFALLEEKACALSDLPLLRIYWYDGLVNGRQSTDQQSLASTDNIKLRLGIVNAVGEQKGVDARIVTDLADLARNSAICDAVLVGGDEDLRIGVELAQERGVRVHLLTVEGTNVSNLLRQESDTNTQITRKEVSTFLTINPAAPPQPAKAPAQAAPPQTAAKFAQAMKGTCAVQPTTGNSQPAKPPEKVSEKTVDYPAVVAQYLASLTEPEKAAFESAMASSSSSVPREHDGKVLAQARDSIGRSLTSEELRYLRDEVRKQTATK